MEIVAMIEIVRGIANLVPIIPPPVVLLRTVGGTFSLSRWTGWQA
jgi:hypothetical protein